MARKRKQSPDQIDLLQARVATAPCVPGIRENVKVWREGGYKGVSDTTRILQLLVPDGSQAARRPQV